MAKSAGSEPPDLGGFLQDWTALWRQEVAAQAADPPDARAAMAQAMETWRSAMALWSGMVPPVPPHEPAGPARTAAAAAASDAVDDAIGRLTRRIDELERRIAKLEAPRRRRS